MSYFDQNVVTWQCAVTVQEMLNSFAMGNSNYLPVQEHVAFLFDLMEMALNIFGLIDMCIQVKTRSRILYDLKFLINVYLICLDFERTTGSGIAITS